jgi:predicted dehydrogenase
MAPPSESSRRDFLKLAATAAVAASAASAASASAEDEKPIVGCGKPAGTAAGAATAKRVGIATIGLGGQGNSDTKAMLKTPGVELVAVADLYDGRLKRAREVYCDNVVTTRDYKEVLARPDVDAVIIATPDHWHSRIAIEAMNAGKDVYVEKPMVHSVEEGLQVVEAQRRTKRILQVGSQRVSSVVYHKAKELLAAGAIGELNMVEAWWNRNSAIGAWQYTIPPDASPQTVDWERFLGPAPRRPFDATRFFRWRNYDDYGTGVAGDLFVHLFTGVHFVTGSLGPTRVMATGGIRYWKDGRDAPDVMLGLFEYPKTAAHPEFTLSLRVDFAAGAGGEDAFRFVGPEGIMNIGRDGITITKREPEKEPGYTIDTFSKAIQDAYLADYRKKYPERKNEIRTGREERYERPQDYNETDAHTANFVEAVRTRTPVVEDSVFGLRAAGPALLCNASQREHREVTWDPETMRRTDGHGVETTSTR